MQSQVRMSPSVRELLCCPACHGKLREQGERFECVNAGCAGSYPVVDGIPVLVNERLSVFSLNEYVSGNDTYFATESRLKKIVRGLVPSISANIKGKSNYRELARILLSDSASPRVLVIGGSLLGYGMEALVNQKEIELVESDVSIGPRIVVVCDAHCIPFEDGAFDAVVAQAVLEHVVDPHRCSDEIHRVLKSRGIVYAETPFMQQVHGGRFDFTRFTHLGHRRLFRRYEEISSGALDGPGGALAWSYEYFLLGFATSKTLRSLIRTFARLSGFFLKYFDYFLINKPGAMDGATGYYFMGRKSDQVLSDRELIKLYKGSV
jgi:uncharacterized protein YbaR (Trm112 family)